jgi:hypothetical protein
VLPLAHLVVAYYFQWDMRSVNCNLIVLAVVLFGCAALAAGCDKAAGFWFAASVALKLFPVLVLPYLAWTRRWRALLWAVTFSAAYWVLLPLLAFGDGFANVYEGWVSELMRAADPARIQLHPILISLNKAVAHLAAGNAALVWSLRYGVAALWLLVGLLGAAVSRLACPRDGFACLAHVSLLVLGPVAVNPYLEPYHLVPLAIPSVLVLSVTLEVGVRRRVRIGAAIGFLLGLAILKASCPWPCRGLLVNAQALVLCSVAVWASWGRIKEPKIAARRAGSDPKLLRASRHRLLHSLLPGRTGVLVVLRACRVLRSPPLVNSVRLPYGGKFPHLADNVLSERNPPRAEDNQLHHQ